MDLDVGNPFLEAFEGVGPEIETFLGPEMALTGGPWNLNFFGPK